MKCINAFVCLIFWISFQCVNCMAQDYQNDQIKISTIGEGWAGNSINTVIFRRNALDSKDGLQFAAYYDPDGKVVLAKRKLDEEVWQTETTAFTGNVKDAHNAISIVLDGDGFLHMSWDHHDNQLHYAKSVEPYSLIMGDMESLTGSEESHVTYPEFYRLPDGDLIMMYRSGGSGRGNLVINHYDLYAQSWRQIHRNLIDGEGERSAYWQACIDDEGFIHLSWVWRESWDVETNHDMAYAISKDKGHTWENHLGEKYALPIKQNTATYAWRIPQNSNLINQTAITTDKKGNPYIATYWTDSAENQVTQLQVIYQKGKAWKKVSPNHRSQFFDLAGGGTKRIPISRPQLLVDHKGVMYLIYRDEEFGGKVLLVHGKSKRWKMTALSSEDVGQWEPTLDISRWKDEKELHLFVQKVTQIDGEGLADHKSSPVTVLQIKHLNQIKSN